MEKSSRIFVAGHRGLVGSALVRKLRASGYNNLILRTKEELDLRSQTDVYSFFKKNKPKYVFLAAAKVGGILANSTYPANFIYENLVIQTNVIHASYLSGVKKLLFLGSSCIYPRLAPQPIKEEYLLTGELEPTNEAYAMAKLAGLKMCQAYNFQYGCNFISVMPTNLYGPNDNFDLNSSHVLAALLRKFYEAKVKQQQKVIIWGTGKPRREFLYVDDFADACLFLMQNYNGSQPINVGTGTDLTIKDLAFLIKEIVQFKGDIEFDLTKPDGMPQKLLDISKITKLGWRPQTSLKKGIAMTYHWFTSNYKFIAQEEKTHSLSL